MNHRFTISVLHHPLFIDLSFFSSRIVPIPRDWMCVAEVEVLAIDRDAAMREAYTRTNTIDQYWWENDGVCPLFKSEGCRSTSAGDMFYIAEEDAHYVICEAGYMPLLAYRDEKVALARLNPKNLYEPLTDEEWERVGLTVEPVDEVDDEVAVTETLTRRRTGLRVIVVDEAKQIRYALTRETRRSCTSLLWTRYHDGEAQSVDTATRLSSGVTLRGIEAFVHWHLSIAPGK